MAQLALAVVGSAIGAGFAGIPALGLTGSALGWAGGSLLGSLLGQKAVHTRQPGLGDKSVQVSTYGQMQTLLYGTMRLAGNVIDGVGEIREVPHTTRVGKGGPKGSNTTLSWNVDIAIDLAQAGVQGIRKIWQGGKLVYDVSTGGTASSIIASAIKATSFTLYDGSESQLPDPTLEALHGVGNVPAYRGRSYIVVAGLDCLNGQIPQLMFEVCMAITPSATLPAMTPAIPFHPNTATQGYVYTSNSRVLGPTVVYSVAANENTGNGWQAQGFKGGNGYVNKLWSVTWPSLGTGAYGRMPGLNGSHKTPKMCRAALGLNGVYSTTNTLSVIDMLTGVETTVRQFVPGTVDYNLSPAYAAWDEITQRFVLIGLATGGVSYERFNPGIYTVESGLQTRIALPSSSGVMLAYYAGIVYTLDQRSGVTYLQRWDGDTGACIDEIGGGPGTINCTTELALGADPISSAAILGYDTAISAHAGGIFVYAKSLKKAWRIGSSWVQVSNTVADSLYNVGIMNAWIEQDYVAEGPLVAAPDNAMHYRVGAMKSFDPQDVSIASIISDICLRSGLMASQIDVSGLTRDVRGYAITSQITGRAAIEPLLKAALADGREQDGKIDFIARADQISSFSVSYDELAAVLDGDEPGDPLPLIHREEMQLPRSMTVSFIDVAGDYQANAARAKRIITTANSDHSEELAIATTADHAATIAEALMFDAWSARDARVATLLRKFAGVTPADIGTFEYPRGVFSNKRVTAASDDGILLTLELVDADVQLYDADTPGVSMPVEQEGLRLIAPARLVIMDIPILRDSDNFNGPYVAMAGVTTPWSGGSLYVGNDDASLVPVASVSSGCSVGIASNALATWTQNTIDTVNTVRVEEVGAQSSTTIDGALNNHENLWLIGDELLYAITATYVSAGVYDLSNLVRGLRGTERYRSTHAAYERAVQIPTTGQGIMHPSMDIGEIGQERQYRAISFGLDVDSELSTPFTLQGNGLKPLQVVNFKREALNGNNIFTWDRRSRFSGEFPDGSDIALGEASELYYVDIYSDSTFTLIKRTLSTNTPRAVYTLAQQTTDFGGYQAALYLRVSQVSALVGRGIELEVSGTLANINSTPPSLLAHFDGAGVSTNPIDSSTYAFAGSLTGNAVLSNTQSLYGGSSLYVAGGASANHGTFDTSSAAHGFGTGDFSVIFSFFPVAATDNRHSFAISNTGTISALYSQIMMYMDIRTDNQTLSVYVSNGTAYEATLATGALAFTIGAWNHLALCRRGGVMRLFLNGVLVASAASVGALNYVSTFKVMVGGWNNSASATMYYDNLMILKGEGLYVSNFAVPTEPYSY